LQNHLPNVPGAARAVVLVSGCAKSDPPRYHVSGTISLDGQPVPAGAIILTPDTSRQGGGPQGRADIREGSFSTAKGGLGILGGPYVMEIRGTDGVPFEGQEETIHEGKPLFPPVLAPLDMPAGDVAIQIDVHAEAGRYRADVRVLSP
jgi:hypothetical protein